MCLKCFSLRIKVVILLPYRNSVKTRSLTSGSKKSIVFGEEINKIGKGVLLDSF